MALPAMQEILASQDMWDFSDWTYPPRSCVVRTWVLRWSGPPITRSFLGYGPT